VHARALRRGKRLEQSSDALRGDPRSLILDGEHRWATAPVHAQAHRRPGLRAPRSRCGSGQCSALEQVPVGRHQSSGGGPLQLQGDVRLAGQILEAPARMLSANVLSSMGRKSCGLASRVRSEKSVTNSAQRGETSEASDSRLRGSSRDRSSLRAARIGGKMVRRAPGVVTPAAIRRRCGSALRARGGDACDGQDVGRW